MIQSPSGEIAIDSSLCVCSSNSDSGSFTILFTGYLNILSFNSKKEVSEQECIRSKCFFVKEGIQTVEFPRTVEVKDHTLMIREAEPSDAEKMIEYVNTIASESNNISLGPGDFTITPEREKEIVQSYKNKDNMVFLVGYIGDELVALCDFSSSSRPRMKHTGELGISVLKKYWRYGIGRAMLGTLIDWAKSTGIIRKMNLRVTTYNVGGIALYEQMGFKKDGIITRDMKIEGKFVDTIHMGLEID